MPMLVNQKVLDTLVAPTYTCVVSSHSYSLSPRQYLDETVETKREAGCHRNLPQRQSTRCPGVSRRFRHRWGSVSGPL